MTQLDQHPINAYVLAAMLDKPAHITHGMMYDYIADWQHDINARDMLALHAPDLHHQLLTAPNLGVWYNAVSSAATYLTSDRLAFSARQAEIEAEIERVKK